MGHRVGRDIQNQLETGAGPRSESDTRSVILNAAVELLEEQWAGGVKIVDVAEKAHVGAPTVYYYFDGKEGLLTEAKLVALDRILDNSSNDNGALALLGELLEETESPWDEEGKESFWELLSILGDLRKAPYARERAMGMLASRLSQ